MTDDSYGQSSMVVCVKQKYGFSARGVFRPGLFLMIKV